MATMLNQAKEKVLLKRCADTGSIQITHFAVGTAPKYTVNPAQTDLVNRINIGASDKKAIEGYEVIDSTTVRYECILAENECVGSDITELALVDGDGDVVCIKSFLPKQKTDEREMIFYVDDTWEGVN